MKAIGIILSLIIYAIILSPSAYLMTKIGLFRDTTDYIGVACVIITYVAAIIYGFIISDKFVKWFKSNIK